MTQEGDIGDSEFDGVNITPDPAPPLAGILEPYPGRGAVAVYPAAVLPAASVNRPDA